MLQLPAVSTPIGWSPHGTWSSLRHAHPCPQVFPPANPQIISQLSTTDVIIYGMGSLYTSICPTLILRGMGEAISAASAPKVLILNGFHDRETGGCWSDAREMSASDIVQAVCTALNRTYTHSSRGARLQNSPGDYVTALIVPKQPGVGAIDVDTKQLKAMGIQRLQEVETRLDSKGRALYEPEQLVKGIEEIVLAHAEESRHGRIPAGGQ